MAERVANAIVRALETSSVRMWSASAQSTALRLARSITVIGRPSPPRGYVRDVADIAGRRAPRSARSGAEPGPGPRPGWPGRGWWFLRHRFLQRPSRPARRINRRTRRRPQVAARSSSSRCTRGEPSVPSESLWIRRILLGQLGFGDDPGRGDLPLALVVGGTGDLEHVAAVFTLRPSASSTSMKPSSFTGSPLRRTLAYFWLGDPGKCIPGNRSSLARDPPAVPRPFRTRPSSCRVQPESHRPVPFSECRPQASGLCLSVAVDDHVIRVTFKRRAGLLPVHSPINA